MSLGIYLKSCVIRLMIGKYREKWVCPKCGNNKSQKGVKVNTRVLYPFQYNCNACKYQVWITDEEDELKTLVKGD